MTQEAKLNKKEALKQEIANWEQKYQRALADYQNLIKQKDKEQQELIKFANSALLQEILLVYDHLKLSLEHADQGSEWLKGLEYTIKQFGEVLTSRGVREVPTKDLPFDHHAMEALSEVATADPGQDGLVAQQLQPGYWLHDRLLVSAKVAVYKYQAKEEV